jgi:hypothetical protein
MGKDKEWSGLLKIPDEEVIKQLRVELGKANSFIEELNYKIRNLEIELDDKCIKLNSFKKGNNKLDLPRDVKDILSDLNKKIISQGKEIAHLKNENRILKNQLFDTRERFVILHRELKNQNVLPKGIEHKTIKQKNGKSKIRIGRGDIS